MDQTSLRVQAQFDALEALPPTSPNRLLISLMSNCTAPVDLRIDAFQVLLGRKHRAAWRRPFLRPRSLKDPRSSDAYQEVAKSSDAVLLCECSEARMS